MTMNLRLLVQSCFCLTLLGGLMVGCQSKFANLPEYHASTQPLVARGLSDLKPLVPVDAMVDPPVGWVADELKHDDRHSHQAWKSPSGNTAYGIIHFGIPLPVPAYIVLPSYLSAMKESEGEADLVGQAQKDDTLPGIRFTVDCGDYRMRTNFICKGFGGWAIYAGTLRSKEVNPAELELAERAREKTRIGVPATAGKPTAEVIRPSALASE